MKTLKKKVFKDEVVLDIEVFEDDFGKSLTVRNDAEGLEIFEVALQHEITEVITVAAEIAQTMKEWNFDEYNNLLRQRIYLR